MEIRIGKDCFFNHGCSINALESVTIGDGCIFGENVKIYDHNHRFADINEKIKNQGYSTGAVSIGNRCWFGSNVIVLKGAHIGNNCVIGAGCVIYEDIPDDSVVTMDRKINIVAIDRPKLVASEGNTDMEPIRILHENVIMDPGGIETQLMRIYRNIDKSKVQFDFLLHRTQKGAFDDEIRAMGGRIYYAEPFNPFHHTKYMNSMKKFFAEHTEYKIMIAHTELALCPLKVAAKAGVPWRICYSHNGRFAFNLKRFFMDYETHFIKKYCTEMFAVSDLAARYTFGDKAVDEGKVRLIKNGIMVDDFIFDESKRNEKRAELRLDNKFIVGHVGRFMQQKNHMFLLEIFAELHKLRDDAHLILIGEGRLEDDIRAKIKELDIEDNVSILGRRNDVNDLMKAMDVLLFPSLWEGFPNVAIEAQASSLPVYMSENITTEANFSRYSHRLSLDSGVKAWAEKVYKDSLTPVERIDMSSEMREQGYDVVATAKWYEDYYLNKMKELGC